MRRRRRAAGGVAAVAILALLMGATLALALPKRFVPVDSGHFAGTDWELAMGARGSDRCYRLTLAGRGGWSQAKVCDQGIPRRHLWDSEFGSSDGVATARVTISAPEVRRVNLLLAHPNSDQRPNWRSLPMYLLTAGQAKRAHLKRDFRYAVLTAAGDLCVKKVRAFGVGGELLERRNTPCEY